MYSCTESNVQYWYWAFAGAEVRASHDVRNIPSFYLTQHSQGKYARLEDLSKGFHKFIKKCSSKNMLKAYEYHGLTPHVITVQPKPPKDLRYYLQGEGEEEVGRVNVLGFVIYKSG